MRKIETEKNILLRLRALVMILMIGAFFACGIFLLEDKAVFADEEGEDEEVHVEIYGGVIDNNDSELICYEGEVLKLTADPAPEGMSFKCWHICNANGEEYGVKYSDASELAASFNSRTFIFIGDSYQNGVLESKRSFSWLDYLLLRHGKDMAGYYRNDENGYGFSKSGMQFISLLKSVESSVEDKARITDVVTVGCYNDKNNIGSINNDISEYAAYIRSTYPNARIWIIPAEWTSNTDIQYSVSMAYDGYIRAAEQYDALTNADAIKVMKNEDLICMDTVHPNYEGALALSYEIENILAGSSVNESYSTAKFAYGTMAESAEAYITVPEQDIVVYAEYESNGAFSETSINGFYERKYCSEEGWYYYKDNIWLRGYNGFAEGSVDGEYDWWYIRNGKVDTTVSGFAAHDGSWWYVKNGRIDTSANSVIKGSVRGELAWWYVENGIVCEDYTGFAENETGWWYVKNGKTDFSLNGLKKGTINGEEAWWYTRDGEAELDYSGFVKNDSGWWYCYDGRVDFSAEGIFKGTVENETGWWYVKGGNVKQNFVGFAMNENGWWYCRDGRIDFTAGGLIKGTVNGESGWWYVKNGNVDQEYLGFGKNENGWWYCRNGKVDFSVNDVIKGNVNGTTAWWRVKGGKVDLEYRGLEKNSEGWWYIRNGKVDNFYTGFAQNSNGWWYCRNGKVEFSYNSVEKNENGWWRIKDGKVDFSFTGLAENKYGLWYCKGGKVDFNCSGLVNYDNNWWYIKNGKAELYYTGILKNENGWWYCKNGKVDFTYKGFAQNSNGWWYCRNGQVDFKMRASVKGTINGETRWWNVWDGKVKNK